MEQEQITMRDNFDLWWRKSEQTDAAIRHNYSKLHTAEMLGELDEFTTPEQTLSRIILLDQFSRNMFRDSPQAFFADARARWLAYIVLPEIHTFNPMEQVFILLPFEHSESIAEQSISLQGFQRLHAQASEEHKSLFANYLNFAQQHLNIIARFARFPHRNTILQRPSSHAELEFLRQPGSSF